MYINDNDGWLPPVISSVWKNPPDEWSGYTWATMLKPYVNDPNPPVYTVGYNDLVEVGGVFWDPSLNNNLKTSATTFHAVWTAYGMHHYAVGGSDAGVSINKGYRRESQIVAPSEQIVLADSYDPSIPNRGYYLLWSPLNGQPPTVDFRHSGKANVLFADGHVEAMDKATLWDPYVSGGPLNAVTTGPWRIQ